MKILFLGCLGLLLCLTSACAKRDNECRNRDEMRMECQVVNTPSYGRPFAQELCARQYQTERCY